MGVVPVFNQREKMTFCSSIFRWSRMWWRSDITVLSEGKVQIITQIVYPVHPRCCERICTSWIKQVAKCHRYYRFISWDQFGRKSYFAKSDQNKILVRFQCINMIFVTICFPKIDILQLWGGAEKFLQSSTHYSYHIQVMCGHFRSTVYSVGALA